MAKNMSGLAFIKTADTRPTNTMSNRTFFRADTTNTFVTFCVQFARRLFTTEPVSLNISKNSTI